MITLNDYLYSGDTVLRILKKYIADLRISAVQKHNEVDLVHCNFLIQIMKLLEHNDFLTSQSQKIREFYKYITIADLSGKRLLDEDSLLEALQYRAQEKVDLTF